MLATGSEVELAIRAKERLVGKVNIRIVFMSCMKLFDMRVKEYSEEILPQDVEKRIFIELSDDGLVNKYIGLKGKVIDVNSFGQSAPTRVLMKEYGFIVDRVMEEVERMMAK